MQGARPLPEGPTSLGNGRHPEGADRSVSHLRGVY